MAVVCSPFNKRLTTADDDAGGVGWTRNSGEGRLGGVRGGTRLTSRRKRHMGSYGLSRCRGRLFFDASETRVRAAVFDYIDQFSNARR